MYRLQTFAQGWTVPAGLEEGNTHAQLNTYCERRPLNGPCPHQAPHCVTAVTGNEGFLRQAQDDGNDVPPGYLSCAQDR